MTLYRYIGIYFDTVTIILIRLNANEFILLKPWTYIKLYIIKNNFHILYYSISKLLFINKLNVNYFYYKPICSENHHILKLNILFLFFIDGKILTIIYYTDDSIIH